MEKSQVQFSGIVAEMLENKQGKQARIICDSGNVMITVDYISELELGGKVILNGELEIKSLVIDEEKSYEIDQK